MKNCFPRTCFFLSVLLVPGILCAASPAAITGIQTEIEDGSVHISWDSPTEQNISYYRVYFSSESILENGGEYDDFEATPDAKSSYILQYKPTGGMLYISMLAVNDAGEEGSIFVEEAVVFVQIENNGNDDDEPIAPVLQDASPLLPPIESDEPKDPVFDVVTPGDQRADDGNDDPSDTPPEWQARNLGGTLHLLLADVISPTELNLLFSGRPTVEPAAAPRAFSIVDTDGRQLRIKSILIDQEEISVQTEEQVRGKTYKVVLSEPLHGEDGSPLDETNRQAIFMGHKEGREIVSNQVTPVVPTENLWMNPLPICDLTLATSSLLNGTYFVKAQWDLLCSPADIAYYSVRQSRDGGQTFGEPQLLQGNISSIEIPGVTPGEYGIGITILNIYEFASAEVFKSIVVGPQQTPAPLQPTTPSVFAPLTQPVGTQAPQQIDAPEPVVATSIGSSNLAQSGAGLALGSLAGFGMFAGWRRVRRKRK